VSALTGSVTTLKGRATRVTELTGAHLATAIAWGVVKGFGIWAVIGAVVALVVAIFARG